MQAAEGYGIGPVVEGEPAHEVDRRFKHADGIQRRIIGQAERDFLVAAGYVAFERGAAPGAPLGGKYRFPGGVTPHENAVMIFLVLVEQARFDEIFDDAGGDAAPAQVGAYALVIVIGRGKDEWGPLSPGRRKRFSGKIRVLEGDGKVSVEDGRLWIRGCSRAVLSVEAVRPASLEGDYEAIRKAHVDDYRKIFDSVELYLGEQLEQPTDVRLENLRAGGEDNGLFGLYFQYGRYLMIASSRKGSFPANLQGIWSWQWQAPWSSNWTTNINLEMNYWPAMSCGLEECMEPYFSYVEKLAEHGEHTAAVNYRCRGSVQHHNADAWYTTTPMGMGYGSERGEKGCVSWSMWPMGLAWLAQEFYHYYEYSGDRDFLRRKAYPMFRANALFLVDWLVEHEGRYVTCPSTSPENRYYTPEGESCCVTYGSAMDLELTEDVFRHFLKICELLDIEDPLIREVEERLSKLEPVKKGSFGQILEWAGEYREVEPGHRHVSHLYGLYPSELWADRQDMMEAARISLETRLKNGGGYTGWSCAWIVNLFGILKDGEQAWKYLHILLTRSTYPNLWDAHEPFQIDGNFGGIAGICNMLVQDRGGEVMLLPALPKQFASGYARGLRIKGGKVVDIAWEDGKLVSSEIREKN